MALAARQSGAAAPPWRSEHGSSFGMTMPPGHHVSNVSRPRGTEAALPKPKPPLTGPVVRIGSSKGSRLPATALCTTARAQWKTTMMRRDLFNCPTRPASRRTAEAGPWPDFPAVRRAVLVALIAPATIACLAITAALAQEQDVGVRAGLLPLLKKLLAQRQAQARGGQPGKTPGN